MKNKEYYIRLGEAVERLEEKNCPTDPSKWSYYKSQAKKKFDVYPSAYANGWASKQYGDAGGSWKKCASEATDSQETEFHTQLDKLVHKTFGKRPEEMDEKFDKTHLGILQYAFKDIDRINPSEPAYKRLVDMLNKLSKQELQQIASVDIKFLSLLAKNLLTKKESVNEASIDVDVYRKKQAFVIGPKFAEVASDSDVELMARLKIVNSEHEWQLKQNIKSMDHLYKKYKLRSKKGIEESVVNESHFQVGDKVKMSHGGVGVVKSLDKEDGADDEKYYNIELPNGEVMKHAPNELTLSVNEGVSRDAAYIHGILQSGQDATQNFIDDNGLDGEKLSDYVKANRNNIDGYNVKHYISGERGTVGSVPKLRQAFIKKFKKGKSANESHFQVGDKVKMLHGGVGVVKSLDKKDGADDEKYYNIELPNGDVMKHAPNELTAESVNEGKAYSNKFAAWFTGTVLNTVKHPTYGTHQLTADQIEKSSGDYKNKLFKAIEVAVKNGDITPDVIRKNESLRLTTF
jgi:RNA polymerase-interacting CarD/CdnL/TRCF family regulator